METILDQIADRYAKKTAKKEMRKISKIFYKAVKQGVNHKRVPSDIAENPVIIGHELCGEIVKVGAALTGEWKEGQKAVVQPALKTPDGHDPGYSFRWIGGASTYIVVPPIVLEKGCLVPYEGESIDTASPFYLDSRYGKINLISPTVIQSKIPPNIENAVIVLSNKGILILSELRTISVVCPRLPGI